MASSVGSLSRFHSCAKDSLVGELAYQTYRSNDSSPVYCIHVLQTNLSLDYKKRADRLKQFTPNASVWGKLQPSLFHTVTNPLHIPILTQFCCQVCWGEGTFKHLNISPGVSETEWVHPFLQQVVARLGRWLSHQGGWRTVTGTWVWMPSTHGEIMASEALTWNPSPRETESKERIKGQVSGLHSTCTHTHTHAHMHAHTVVHKHV